MSALKNIAGLLALGTALSGAAVVIGGVTAGAAGAATVMGGYVPAPSAGAVRYYPRNYNYNANTNRQRQGHKAANRNKNKNKNKNKQWQHLRQSESQDQFLMRDFTLVLTPFQKSSNGSAAVPWNSQWSQNSTIPYTYSRDWSHLYNRPTQDQESQTLPKENQATQVNPDIEEKKVVKDEEKGKKKHYRAPVFETDLPPIP
ncbi:hypothetical protein GCM10010116_51950 [Microbispora rosea subsp. aerata]|nr:hypothetical protein [Microbispora rosea]GGO25878.1 hypothetical protein GCM10010116_51950 [Microbispora rosea subsp. aerata]GIH56938.1 hypothetical protein Mro02_38520 [Microbispora rosea subsp. aerata]GLJ82863.1 hypothetical protein GCM10017588_15890 [Microbispora rosea subsp. aerata]